MEFINGVVSVIVFLAGASIVGYAVMAAVRTVVLQRGDQVRLTRYVFHSINALFQMRARKAQTYLERDRIMALYAPISLLMLPIAWLVLIVIGYMLMYRAIGVQPLYDALKVSGSSVFTLGFFTVDTLPVTILEFTEATLGLGIVALLLSYLPTMYSAFSRRETLVTLLEVRADSPPSAVTLITRAHGVRGLDYLAELWELWEVWFAEIDESHTSLSAINFFRSPQPDRSWITAAGCVLDTAALVTAVVDMPPSPEAQLCIRAGFVALRHISDFFRIEYYPDPHFPDQPISITREEFDEACKELAAAGVPLKADFDQAWLDFAGWRVNYDTPLLALCELTMAPYAPWSSDRGIQRARGGRAKIGF